MRFIRLNTLEEVSSLIEFHNHESDFVVLDTETTSVNPREARLIDIQLTGRETDEVVILGAAFAPALSALRKDLVIVGHSYKYDAHVLFRHQVNLLDHTWRDTILLGHLADENRESYSLDSYVKEIWNDPYKEEFWKKYKTYEEATEEDAIQYACKDILYTSRLYVRFDANLIGQSIPSSLVTHVHRLQSSLLRTEIKGVCVDQAYLSALGVTLKKRINDLDPKMRELSKDEIYTIELELWLKEVENYKTDKRRAQVEKPRFNFESTQQLISLLYGRLGLSPQRNGKTKALSTDYESLEKIKNEHPIVPLIQENRELQKVYGAYIEGTLNRLDQGRIYPQFRVAGPVTGRISHSNPNLAQLPKEGGVRGIYIPDPGQVLVSADYSQLEVVIEANLTGDRNLIKMIENGESKHDLTARELKCSRDTAKTLNFCLQYWGTHFKVAKLLNLSLKEAEGIWRRYWEVYSGPKALKAETDRCVNAGRPLVTCYGRKRRFEYKKRREWDGDYRQAYNFMIQSPGADFMSESFYKTHEVVYSRGWGRGLFTLHDEGLFSVERGEVAAESEALLIQNMESMSTKYRLKIPLKAKGSGPRERWEDK